MYRRETIDQRISDLQRMLAATDDQLELALLKLAIESFEAERYWLLPGNNQHTAEEAKTNVDT